MGLASGTQVPITSFIDYYISDRIKVSKNPQFLRYVHHDGIQRPAVQDNQEQSKFTKMDLIWSYISQWIILTLLIIIFTVAIGYCYQKMNLYFDSQSISYHYSQQNKDDYMYADSDEVCHSDKYYFLENWYHISYNNPGYVCENFKLISVVNVQGLQIEGQKCNDTQYCDEIIKVYLNIDNTYAKYSLYIDSNANIYGGRGWRCPYSAGELWVAVMVDDFTPDLAPSMQNRILAHLYNEVFTYATECNYLGKALQIHYLNTSVLSLENITEF